MKHIQVIAFCDGEHEERTRAVTERTIKIDGGEPVLLDLCEPCDKPFLDMLVLMERGAVVERTKGPKGKRSGTPSRETRPSRLPGMDVTNLTCPECGHVSPSRSALGQHTRSRHGKGLKEYADKPSAD